MTTNSDSACPARCTLGSEKYFEHSDIVAEVDVAWNKARKIN